MHIQRTRKRIENYWYGARTVWNITTKLAYIKQYKEICDMTIEIKKTENETIIEIAGRLDTITAPALDKTINEDIGDIKNLVLDVKGMEYISSAGLRVLLGAQKKMQKIGSMKVINVCAEVMDVFEMTGFADILVIE